MPSHGNVKLSIQYIDYIIRHATLSLFTLCTSSFSSITLTSLNCPHHTLLRLLPSTLINDINMGAKKQTKGASTKKRSTRQAPKTAGAANNGTANQNSGGPELGPLPFPYEVKKGTLKDTITRYLQTEVGKHHHTTLQLEEALRQVEALKASAASDKEPGTGGDQGEEGQEVADDDMEDMDEDDGEQWTGIATNQQVASDDGGIGEKVQSLETAISAMSRHTSRLPLIEASRNSLPVSTPPYRPSPKPHEWVRRHNKVMSSTWKGTKTRMTMGLRS